jgi:hypothetical protein
VKDNQSSPAGGVNRFQTTRWTLSRVDRSKGKFRSFLLASLKNYLANETDRARCLKRGGKTAFVHIDLEKAEETHELCEALIAAEGWVIP